MGTIVFLNPTRVFRHLASVNLRVLCKPSSNDDIRKLQSEKSAKLVQRQRFRNGSRQQVLRIVRVRVSVWIDVSKPRDFEIEEHLHFPLLIQTQRNGAGSDLVRESE